MLLALRFTRCSSMLKNVLSSTNERFFSGSSDTGSIRKVPGMFEHPDIKGLLTSESLLTQSEHIELKEKLDSEFNKLLKFAKQSITAPRHHSHTGKISQEISYPYAAIGETKTASKKVSVFTDYHHGSEAKNGTHVAVTFPFFVPVFMQPLIERLPLKRYKPNYLFLNKYKLPTETSTQETVFDWHTDLHVFGHVTVIYNIEGTAKLQFYRLTSDELACKKDGFQHPGRQLSDDEIYTIPVEGRQCIILTDDARYHHAHRVILTPGVERTSLAMGMNAL